MPLLEHIDELRSRAIRIFVAVISLTLFFFIFEIRTFNYGSYVIPYPFPNVYHNEAASLIQYLQQNLLPSYVKIIVTSPSDALVSEMIISMFLGLIIALPYVIYQIWAFIAPGLYAKEKMLIFTLTVPATLLFFMGAIMGFLLLVPFAFQFMYLYALTIGAVTYITINDFLMFIILFSAAMGITFEVPIIMVGVTRLGLVKPDAWKRYFRYFIAFSVVYGAFITPDASGITMWLVAIPMIILYGVGYLFSRRMAKEKIVK
jgi:sec-independent protein translocase protein TatC